MIRNNIVTLAVHSIFIFLLVFVRWDKLNSELPFFITTTVCLVLCVIYILVGYLVLKDNGSFMNNILSTVSIIILGLVIWEYCFGKIDYNLLNASIGDDVGTSQWWMWHDSIWVNFSAFTLPSYIITFPLEFIFFVLYINNIPMDVIDATRLFYIFIPSVMFCFGIGLKKEIWRNQLLRFLCELSYWFSYPRSR